MLFYLLKTVDDIIGHINYIFKSYRHNLNLTIDSFIKIYLNNFLFTQNELEECFETCYV